MPRLRESRGLVGLLIVSILFGAAIGLVQVACRPLAGRWDSDWVAGPLLAAFAFGSVVGALWFGSRNWRRPVLERYLLSAARARPAARAASRSRPTRPRSRRCSSLAGLAYGPVTISIFESLDVLAPGGGAEALTWVTTAEAGGWAAGSAVAGLLVIHVATWSPFVIASAILVVPVGVILALRR